MHLSVLKEGENLSAKQENDSWTCPLCPCSLHTSELAFQNHVYTVHEKRLVLYNGK